MKTYPKCLDYKSVNETVKTLLAYADKSEWNAVCLYFFLEVVARIIVAILNTATTLIAKKWKD